jgi:DNA-damage-inducible protein J
MTTHTHSGHKPGQTTFNARIDPRLKQDAELVFQRLDISLTDAFRLFLRQAVLQQGLPFDVKLPNAETVSALAEVQTGGGKVYAGMSPSEVTRAILSESDDEEYPGIRKVQKRPSARPAPRPRHSKAKRRS